MKNTTRLAYLGFVSQIALLNNVASATVQFVATPSVQQTLVDKVQASSEFLAGINMPLVTEKSAEIIGLGLSGTLAKRTNTATTDRSPNDPSVLDNRTYDCKSTEFDTALTYAKLDAWAKFADFQLRIQKQIVQRIASDMLMIGFNGTSAAPSATDRVANPLLQDVNIGWLQKLRAEAPAQVMSDGFDTEVGFTTKVTYGLAPTADFKTLDALVWDARNTLLPVWARGDTGLVVITSSDLVDDKYFPIINQVSTPENQIATDTIMSTKRMGGLPVVTPPHFPLGTVLITRLDNLSIYEQEGAHRRHILDNPKRNQIEDYQSGNYAYVIEDLDYACMVENIALNN